MDISKIYDETGNEERDFSKEIDVFYKAFNQQNHFKINAILHTQGNNGLADIFKEDYEAAREAALHSGLKLQYPISDLYKYLPSPNRKWTSEERALIECLIINVNINKYTDEAYLESHLKVLYKEILQIIRTTRESKCA